MIIGITGTLGAGKGTIGEYLVNQKGFKHYSARAIFNEELARRGIPSNRDTITAVANDLRAQHGPGYVAEQLLARAKEAGSDAVIESIRTVSEAEYLKSHGAFVWAVDADIKTRYERISGRGSETDAVSFDKFVADEDREMTNTDPTKQNIKGVMTLADHTFRNDGTPEELFAQVEEALAKIQ